MCISAILANSRNSGKRIITTGMRALVKEMVVAGKSVPCAYITPSTKIVFRSESARLFLFIRMSYDFLILWLSRDEALFTF